MELEYRPADTSDVKPLYKLNREQIDRYEDVWKLDYDKVLAWIRKKLEDGIREYSCIFWNGNRTGCFRLYPINGKMKIDDPYVFFSRSQSWNWYGGTEEMPRIDRPSRFPICVFSQYSGCSAVPPSGI